MKKGIEYSVSTHKPQAITQKNLLCSWKNQSWNTFNETSATKRKKLQHLIPPCTTLSTLTFPAGQVDSPATPA